MNGRFDLINMVMANGAERELVDGGFSRVDLGNGNESCYRFYIQMQKSINTQSMHLLYINYSFFVVCFFSRIIEMDDFGCVREKKDVRFVKRTVRFVILL